MIHVGKKKKKKKKNHIFFLKPWSHSCFQELWLFTPRNVSFSFSSFHLGRVCQSADLGRYLEASRDITAGEVIMRDTPLVVGPKQVSLFRSRQVSKEVEPLDKFHRVALFYCFD